MSRPSLTVCICTALRAESLRDTLEALARTEAPDGPWEVVVVDNRPDEGDVQAVIGDLSSALPLVALEEPRPGLSHARNRAVAQARGDLLLFTDDDVTVDAGWLRAYEQALRSPPDVAVWGGPIRPAFERARPEWVEAVRRHVPTSFAWLDPDGPVALSAAEGGTLPFGANFAVRKDALGTDPFDPALGRQPGRVLLGGEETRVMHDILARGARGQWLPDAPVTHRIERERMTRGYQRRYWHGVGWAEGILDATQRTHLDPKWWVDNLARDARAARRAWRRARWRGPAQWIPALRDHAMAKGRCEGYAAALRNEEAPCDRS